MYLALCFYNLYRPISGKLTLPHSSIPILLYNKHVYLHAAKKDDCEKSRKQHECINEKRKEVENTEPIHQKIEAAIPKDVEVSS